MRKQEVTGDIHKRPIPDEVKKNVEMLMDLYPDRIPELVHHMCSYWMDKQEETQPDARHVVICSFNTAVHVPEKSDETRDAYEADIRTFMSGNYVDIESALTDIYEDSPQLSLIREARGAGIYNRVVLQALTSKA